MQKRTFEDKDKKYTNHLKKYRDKIENLEDTIVKYRIVLKRHNGGWTNNLFFCIIGVCLTYLWLLFFSFFQ
jgi:hypothetical protein